MISLHPSNPKEAVRSVRVPVLDVVRATAVLAVFVQHLGDRFRPFLTHEAARTLPLPIASWIGLALARGHWGVDLFFVLSGFTLAMGFLQDHARGSQRTAAEFLTRRAARILPGFYLAMLVHLAYRTDLLRHASIGPALAIHALLLQGYVSPGRLTIIGASWSLTTESHFYLVAPWLARWLLRSPNPTVAARQPMPRSESPHAVGLPLHELACVVGAVCLASWVLRGVLHDIALLPSSRMGMLELTQRKLAVCRIDQFLLGFATALIHKRFSLERAFRPVLGGALVAIALLMLIVAVPFDAATWDTPGGHPAYACVSVALTLLVLGAVWLPDQVVRWLVPLRALGIISYGVFLYHQLALEFVTERVAAANAHSWTGLAWTAVPALALACAAGSVSWFLVESPALSLVARWFRFKKRRQVRAGTASEGGMSRAS